MLSAIWNPILNAEEVLYSNDIQIGSNPW